MAEASALDKFRERVKKAYARFSNALSQMDSDLLNIEKKDEARESERQIQKIKANLFKK